MPLQTNNIVMAGLKGTFGKQVVFRQRGGKTFVSAYPDMSKRVLSPKQLKVNETMRKANEYAQDIMEEEQVRNEAQIRLDVTSNKLYRALIKEYYKNNYVSENGTVAASSGSLAESDTKIPALSLDFATYLLKHSTKSVEEIAGIVKLTSSEVQGIKNNL